MRKCLLGGVLIALAVCPTVAQTLEPPAGGPTQPTPVQRLNDLIVLIEGQTSPEVRQTITRELLLQRWPETTPRVAVLLAGPNAPAKIAVAAVLSQWPEFLDEAYVEPLVGMLGDGDAAVRLAAARALAAYPDHGVTQRLRELVRDQGATRTARLAAVDALGMMTEREAIAGLVEALDDPDPEIMRAALAALEQATAMEFHGDAHAARAWWNETSPLTRPAWQQLQIDRLVRENRDMRRRLEALETRLVQVLEASFLRAPDAQRTALLTTYLGDTATAIRQLGLRLAQVHLAEGKSITAELRNRIRTLMSSTDPTEQAAAVKTVASFRDPEDAARMLQMLADVHVAEVRMALINALGYVGQDDTVVQTLLDLLGSDEPGGHTETVAALGRLAERGVLPADTRDRVVAALLDVFGRTDSAQVALRERALWAMANVGDQRFGSAFRQALDRQEAVSVRLAAVRGIDVLKNGQLADVLADATSDPDPGVRKAAIETLAFIGSAAAERHVQALWDRVVSPEETEDAIRQAAWRAVLEILSKGTAEHVERWLIRLPGNGTPIRQRAAELLELLANLVADTEPVDHERLGRILAQLADQYARLERPTEARETYIAALTELRAARSAVAAETALQLLRFSLLTGRYDQQVAEVVASGESAPDIAAFLQLVSELIETRLTPEQVDQALAILTALRQHPPTTWTADADARLQQLEQRAQGIKSPAPQSAPASHPAAAAPA